MFRFEGSDVSFSAQRQLVADHQGTIVAVALADGTTQTINRYYLNGGDAVGLALYIAGFVPIFAQAAAAAHILKDGYETYRAVQSCP